MRLEKEAARVSRDLRDVVFVGAFAVSCHIGPYRQTRDLDVALATPLRDEDFESLGYSVSTENRKKVIRTPEGVKLDVFTRDVSGIPVSEVFQTAIKKRVGPEVIKVICLEALMVAKMRASRPQDIEDLQIMCQRLGKTVRWSVVDALATSTESSELRNVVSALAGRALRPH